MKGPVLFSILKADFQERTRRSGFLITLFLAIYLGYAVNTGQILILLDTYRGIYNSAWVGSLMSLIITFFLGIFGFYLVKNAIQQDERTGVGQIIAATGITRPQYLLGKWLSNFTILSSLVGILAAGALLMQLIQHEDARIQLWALAAPLLFIALPMMALVAALAVFFETVSWLKGGFGNLVYFFLFTFLLVVGVFLPQVPWLDVTGINLIGSSMKAAARAAFPAYDGMFTLAMIARTPVDTFAWSGLDWTAGLIFQRLGWVAVAAAVTLAGVPFFNRFDSTGYKASRMGKKADAELPVDVAASLPTGAPVRLTPAAPGRRFQPNFLRLVGLEFLLLVKGIKWYWYVGMAAIWLGCAVTPSTNMRPYGYMLSAIVPVLVWSKMGEREARYRTGQLVYPAPYALVRLVGSSWLAGVLLTAVLTVSVVLGRMLYGEPVGLAAWGASVLFIPTLALALGSFSRSSKPFEVIYPILWYLGPMNPQSQLAVLDYLGIHQQSPVITMPWLVAGLSMLLLLFTLAGRRWAVEM